MSLRKIFAVALFAVAVVVTPKVHAIGGIAIQYGLDMSLSMDDKLKEPAVFDSLKINLSSIGTIPAELGSQAVIKGSDIPVYIDRTNWKRSVFNLGGKIYVDIIPVLDAIELSTNFGIWEYEGNIIYPDSMWFLSSQPPVGRPFSERIGVHYDTMQVTLKNFGMNYIGGITGTPYAKLQFDATIRKTLISFPPIVKILKIYAGGGPTVQFATPIISSSLVKEAIETQFNTTFNVNNLTPDLFGNEKIMKPIVDKILSKLMTPHYGMHIDVGAMVNIPIIPLAFYVDGKYLIPFEKLDANLTQSSGLLINLGTAFAL